MKQEILFNFHLKKWVRKILKWVAETTAYLKGHRFYCNALNGGSGYNIVINSDMTVSCNCQDYDGSGHIGNLNKETWEEVFKNSTSQRFREELAKGHLPIDTCARCVELRTIPKKDALLHRDNYQLPKKGIMIENTVLCNFACTSCSRSVQNVRTKKSLSLDDIKKLSALIKEKQIESVCFFNLGEPFLSKTIYEELEILRKENPNLSIHMSTNGTLLDTDKKREAAMMLSHIGVSIDGVGNEAVLKYQKRGNFEKAYKNMKDLVSYRNSKGLKKPTILWYYVLFNWNDKKEMILKAIEMARESGVDSIVFQPTKSPWYGISLRYYLGQFIKNLGSEHQGGRIIKFLSTSLVEKEEDYSKKHWN